MPNQRAPNKVRLGGFIDRGLYEQVIALAQKEGMVGDKFGFAQRLINEALDRRQTRKPKRPQALRTSSGPVNGNSIPSHRRAAPGVLT